MLNNNSDIEKIHSQTLSLIATYKEHDLTIPFALKGNLGEFLVWMELNKRFPGHNVEYLGGAAPGADIIIDDVKIQVKTRINRREEFRSKGEAACYIECDSCPTIKKSTIDDKKCDMIMLVCLYMSEDYSKIEKKNIYLFGRTDFRYFNPLGCWSGNSKGDYTIVNVLKVVGSPPARWQKIIKHYGKKKYRELFDDSLNNWSKLSKLLA